MKKTTYTVPHTTCVRIEPARLLALSINEGGTANPDIDVQSGRYEEGDYTDPDRPSDYWSE